MKLVELTIKNFKSLGDVTIKPSDLSVIIGPNGSGKTNLANAFAFLKDVYSIGLEAAVQRSGGFENIASASNTLTATEIKVDLTIMVTSKSIDEDEYPLLFGTSSWFGIFPLIIKHTFGIHSSKGEIPSEYVISNELVQVYDNHTDQIENYMTIKREDGLLHVNYANDNSNFKAGNDTNIFSIPTSPHHLITSHGIFNYQPLAKYFIGFLSNWSVYQLSPNTAKTPGVPTPNPTLSLYGNNLPVLVDHLVRKEPEIWQEILATMQRVVPTLTDITTGYLYNKTVGLFFHEEGFERPWNAEEVSDGTILALAMLCSVNDPRSTLVFIEEPENSLHPWILRELVNNFKHVAASKNIFITTHSPTLIDMFSPNDIWCISKSDQQTKLNRLTDIATELQADWEEGKYKLSDYLDSGLVPQAIPGGSI